MNAMRPWHYAHLFDDLVAEARKYGYALALHGSMARDADIVAIPWAEDAVGRDEFIEKMKELCKRYMFCDGERCTIEKAPEKKPHGRVAYSILLGGGMYVDLSVMPRLEDKND